MPSAESLRNLPSVDDVLRHPDLASVSDVYPRQQIVEWIRASVEQCRQTILTGATMDANAAIRFVLQQTVQQSMVENGRRQQPVINATGILLHTNLGRAPLAELAVQRMQQSSGYANVEMNLYTGKRNKRGERICELLRLLTGAEDAAIVNNCAAATMLVLQAMAAGKEVIVSRGQLVEIGGGYRLPEVFAASGAILKEVGTTNRTYLRDYENAISENTGAIIRVHRSNFYQGGFVTEPDITDLVSLGKERNVPVIDDLGSGCIQDLTKFGLKEPSVGQSVAAGSDVSLFSGDKLFGGPQAGIIIGRKVWIEAFRKNPMMRALRVDKVTLAAIEATAEIHLSGQAETELPLLRMLSKPVNKVRQACDDVLAQLDVPDSCSVDVVECTSEIGGGSVPGSQIPSFGLRITGHRSDSFTAALRACSPAVLGRIHDDTVLLDLRTVDESQLAELTASLSAALSKVHDNEV
mgnify:CR=1 FL=1